MREAGILTVLTSTEQLGATGVEPYTWGQLRTDEGYIRLMAGHLGSQITDVDITLRAENGNSSRTAHATVRDGYFAAWYPEGRDEASSNTTLTLRLTDGSTVSNLSASQLYEHPRLGQWRCRPHVRLTKEWAAPPLWAGQSRSRGIYPRPHHLGPWRSARHKDHMTSSTAHSRIA